MDRVTWDAAQRAVIDLPADASGVVVGAPGSGKTATAIARVGALVRPSADEAHGILQPDEVLVLTPSRASATALRDRLALAVGVATPGALARSIVAFGYQIVRAEAVHRGEPVPQLLTGPDEDQVIADLLAGDAEDEIDGIVRWPLAAGGRALHAHVPRRAARSARRVRAARSLRRSPGGSCGAARRRGVGGGGILLAGVPVCARPHARSPSRRRGPRP
jgi:hypothetical protein